MKPIVIKLGGSLIKRHVLCKWLGQIADLPGPAVIVPGGGPFADAVRHSQPQIGFSDRAAHTMAILGMEQYGHALLDLDPRLCALRKYRDLRSGRTGVWLPAEVTASADDVAASWDVTSDSLAAWLAIRLHAAALVLVKAAGAPSPRSTVADWARQNLVDAAFPASAARFKGKIVCLGPNDASLLGTAAPRPSVPAEVR